MMNERFIVVMSDDAGKHKVHVIVRRYLINNFFRGHTLFALIHDQTPIAKKICY